jgi:hypothetical protein
MKEVLLNITPQEVDLVLLSLSEYKASWVTIDPIMQKIRKQAIEQINAYNKSQEESNAELPKVEKEVKKAKPSKSKK